jgi:CRISPR system Cascade subunit CasD
MQVLILQLDAPMMSFGDVAVDYRRPVAEYPAQAMVTGLISNALGYFRHETDFLSRLQERLRLASRVDRGGVQIRDYQTVDLSERSPWMLGTRQGVGWTTRGRVEERGGGADAKTGTHIRYRDFWADRIVTLAIALDPPEENPTIAEVEKAFQEPARPLFIGRKSCLPASPLLLGLREASSLLAALQQEPRATRADHGPLPAIWPAGESDPWEMAWDLRDWPNQIHAGSRRVVTGQVDPPEAP